MKLRRIILWALAIIIGLPLIGLLIAAGWIALEDQSNGRLIVGDQEREYLLYVPSSYDVSRPTPLVISLHAGATWPAHQQNLTHWNRLAEEHGFIVVYPAGTPQLLGMARVWWTTPKRVQDDVAFLSALIDKLQSQYNIDPDRIYADGMSNGASMAFALSCLRPDRIAAVGLVAGAHQLPFDWCTETRPMPVIAFHGTADALARYEGGPLGDPFSPVRPVYPPVREFISAWAQRNACAGSSDTRVADDVTRTDYFGCAGDAAVVLHEIEGAGHSWPGGKPPPEWRVGPTSMSIDATEQTWQFFAAHPVARGPARP